MPDCRSFTNVFEQKGFPNPDIEGYEGEHSMESIEKEIHRFFEQYANVKSMKLRKGDDKKFKGSAFIEFEVPEKVQEVCAMTLTFDNSPLDLMPKYVILHSFGNYLFLMHNLGVPILKFCLI